MYKRLLEVQALEAIKNYPCIALIGPRQSGKTTLAKTVFPDFKYFNFESPNTRELFSYDPVTFLKNIQDNVILDEVQNIPILFSYLQEILDNPYDKRKFILTGSNNLNLSNKISQSLAGRTRILTVLPLQHSEIIDSDKRERLDENLLYGSYPRIYNEQLNPTEWLGDYFQTYVQKDIRETINITNIHSFTNFVRLLGGRVGQVMSFNSIANDAGITQPTAKAWYSSLETTFICFSLQAHFKNYNKRITKAPKVFFYDTGLLCYLLRITTVDQLKIHPLRGSIFENWVIGEYVKHYYNQAREAPLYFWRDQHGHEIDLVIDNGLDLDLIEIKSGATFQKEYFKNIKWLNKLQNKDKGSCIYGGEDKIQLNQYDIIPWNQLF